MPTIGNPGWGTGFVNAEVTDLVVTREGFELGKDFLGGFVDVFCAVLTILAGGGLFFAGFF